MLDLLTHHLVSIAVDAPLRHHRQHPRTALVLCLIAAVGYGFGAVF